VRQLFGGAEMAGIKFHGAIDTLISRNHIYRCCRGIWLDWMAQGTHVTRNLLHDNGPREDLFMEVDHGPFLVDNNIMLSGIGILVNSQGGAYAHNGDIAGAVLKLCRRPFRRVQGPGSACNGQVFKPHRLTGRQSKGHYQYADTGVCERCNPWIRLSPFPWF